MSRILLVAGALAIGFLVGRKQPEKPKPVNPSGLVSVSLVDEITITEGPNAVYPYSRCHTIRPIRVAVNGEGETVGPKVIEGERSFVIYFSDSTGGVKVIGLCDPTKSVPPEPPVKFPATEPVAIDEP